MMFVAGGLIWANFLAFHSTGVGWKFEYARYGWPYAFASSYVYSVNNTVTRIPEMEMQGAAIGADVMMAIGLLAGTWFICEWWVYWRLRSRGRES